MDYKELYKGVPKGYFFMGKTEQGYPLFKNWKNQLYIKRALKKPESNEDPNKCWNCNHGVINACSCGGVYKKFLPEEAEERKKLF